MSLSRQRHAGPQNLTLVNDAVTLNVTDINSAIVDISGAWVGTVVFEYSEDGTLWRSASGSPLDVDGAAVRSVTGNGGWAINTAAFEWLRARRSVATSGTAVARIEASGGSRA